MYYSKEFIHFFSTSLTQRAMKMIFRLVVITLWVGFLMPTLSAQEQSVWKTLAEVQYEEPQFVSRGYDSPTPVFSDAIRSLQGQTVTVSGYIYPLKTKKASHHFVLSALPISSCYFCGGGGPETVIEIQAIHPIEYTTRKITVKGILRTHESDPMGLLYTLENVELVQ